MNLIEQLKLAFSEQVEWIQKAKSRFNQTPYKKGADVKVSKMNLMRQMLQGKNLTAQFIMQEEASNE